ncbi:DUF418 domain-containing protein [Pendulispora rubella]|uniref:DUF418 domain-containing protein n=1 Tax=Pendulispora rubella TaxID=2741070 RepID=A0ABZ2L0V2_9BACT
MSLDASIAAELPAVEERSRSPIDRQARIADIDVIRGAALFGVLMCNLAFCFRTPLMAHGGPHWEAGPEHWVSTFEEIFLSDKAMTLFSMLFGAGLTIFYERASARSSGAMALLVRRLFFLCVFGFLHMFLFWNGDILIDYATAGLCALAFMNRRAWVLWVGIVLLTLFPVLGEFWPPLRDAANGLDVTKHYEEAIPIYGHASYVELVRYRFHEAAVYMWRAYIFYWPGTMRNMLVGMLVWRSGVLRAPLAHARALRWTAFLGIVTGLSYPLLRTIYYEMYHQRLIPRESVWRHVFGATSAPLLAAGYAAGIVLLLHGGGVAQRALSKLSPVGRMAFTNYLTQSMVFSTVFYGYGLGLIGQVGYIVPAIMGISFYALQCVVSTYWLRHFRFGPFEWVWRCLTYGRWQPMRLATAQS